MHAPETIRNKDLEICLNDCQQKQRPFIFWDEKEVAGFDLNLLPVLAEHPKDWVEIAPVYEVILIPEGVKTFKSYAGGVVAVNQADAGAKDVGFAILWRNEQEMAIQVYQKK